MKFITAFKEKQQTARQNDIQQQAMETITLSDFSGVIFISYNGVPMIPVEESWTPKDILDKLDETRKSFINYKMTIANKMTNISLL